MTKIVITERSENSKNLNYILSTLRETFNQTESSFYLSESEQRGKLEILVPDFYSEIIKSEVFDKVGDVIVINYKYDYFKKKIVVNGLTEVERELLFASLIAADLEEDKKYVIERYKKQTEIAIDGIYNFKLKLLKNKWEEIVSYIPSYFSKEQLKEFITYLIDGRKRKIYVDMGRVYDVRFRPQKRGELMDESFLEGKIIREIILSGCGLIELNGNLPKTDEFYLMEYYGDKVLMSKTT
ncbi:MAG: hypothetical protein E7342_01665 [Clostridiales bacterium]|nr:hypothetical protein [Clostridiales bacterium]